LLDLTFLATGYRQHVFTRTDEDDGWVYKVPVAFGHLLPFDYSRLAAAAPRRRTQRIAQRLLIHGPHALRDRLARSDESAAGKSARRALLTGASAVSERLFTLRDRALVSYFMRKRRREFQRMLALLEYLAACKADQVLVPTRSIADSRALLRVDGADFTYTGPILLQRRTAFFVTSGRSLERYDWRDLVRAQQHLWRYGVAILETGEILGPKSWSLFDGQLRLADTSSLTRDYELAQVSLSKARLDDRERLIRERLRTEGSTFPVDEYLRSVRAEINLDNFHRLWKSAVRTQRPVPV
jgi:hypothetical protein